VVRRYYREDLRERLQRAFAPDFHEAATAAAIIAAVTIFSGESGRRFAGRGVFTPGAAGRFAGRPPPSLERQPDHRPRPLSGGERPAGAEPIMRGQRSAISRREALILQNPDQPPWLLHDHLEEVAALELAHPEAHKLRAGIISAFAATITRTRNHRNRPRSSGRPRMRRIIANTSRG